MNILHMVSQTNWEREEISANTVISVKCSYGLDIPVYDSGDVWRIPQNPASHFKLSGAQLTLQAPGPFWLDSVPVELLGRSVVTLRADEVGSVVTGEDMFWKFAETKNESFLAQQISTQNVLSYLHEFHIPNDSILQFSSRVNLGNEYRFFVCDKKAITGSLYLARDSDGNETIIYDGAKAPLVEYERALNFLNGCLPDLDIPDGVVIDVSFIGERPIILEANPAWCSGWYDSDIDKVVETIIASCRVSKLWEWVPDSFLIQKNTKKPDLKMA